MGRPAVETNRSADSTTHAAAGHAARHRRALATHAHAHRPLRRDDWHHARLHQARAACLVRLASSHRGRHERRVRLLISLCLHYRRSRRRNDVDAARQQSHPHPGAHRFKRARDGKGSSPVVRYFREEEDPRMTRIGSVSSVVYGLTMLALKLSKVRKAFGPTVALDGVDLDLRPGEVHALIGENGAGKSTLMNVIAGALKPDEGHMELDGRPSSH